jgi:hypothetical protein
MWKLGLRPRNSFCGNTEMGFLLQCSLRAQPTSIDRSLFPLSLHPFTSPLNLLYAPLMRPNANPYSPSPLQPTLYMSPLSLNPPGCSLTRAPALYTRVIQPTPLYTVVQPPLCLRPYTSPLFPYRHQNRRCWESQD